MVYALLGLGVVLLLVSILTRSKAPKISLAAVVLTMVVLVATAVTFYFTVPQYNAFVEALANQFA